jgi:hypothetical protein
MGRTALPPEKELELGEAEALTEALSIINAMRNGVDFSDVLYITTPVMQALDSFRRQFPEDAWLVDRALKFRVMVHLHLNRLLGKVRNDGVVTTPGAGSNGTTASAVEV